MTSADAPARSPVGVVVLNWNQAALTLRCVAGLFAPGRAVRPDVLVIDNGSSPADVAALAAGLPQGCRLIRNPRNLGFAGGMNVGTRDALRRGYDFVWLLNNDAFPAVDCLPRLLAALDADSTLGSVTPALFGEDGKEQGAVATIRWDPLQNDIAPGTTTPGPVGAGYWLHGAAMLFRADALRRAGGFDERFFAYWEEVDLFQRVAVLGYRFRAVPEATCVHIGNASTGGGVSPFSWYMIARNSWLFLRKHARVWKAPGTGLRLLAGQLAQAGLLNKTGHRPAAKALLAGAAAGLAGRVGAPGKLRPPGTWADVLLLRPWGLSKLLRRSAAFLPAEADA